jgi:two-component system nitrogen regulation response regulator NtrX
MLKRVLVVDDEESILFAYGRLLASEGFKVDVCATLDRAIEMLRFCQYDYVISDMRINESNDTDGLSILKYVNDYMPSTQVIIATGYGDEDTKRRAFELGAKYYFEKPIDTAKLLMILKE